MIDVPDQDASTSSSATIVMGDCNLLVELLLIDSETVSIAILLLPCSKYPVCTFTR